MTTTVMDQPGVLQVSSGYRHALTASAEHVSDELLGHEQLRTIFPIVTQKQPTTEPLFHGVQPVAHCGLGNLRDECLCVSQKQMLQRPAMREFFSQQLG